MNCRHCASELKNLFLDLGYAPPSNAYLTTSQLRDPEIHYPLRVYVCHSCWLVQTEDFADETLLFNQDYAYFSSVSQSWLEHTESYCKNVVERFHLDSDSFVVEIASNDGYLLKNFVARNIPCLGIEPTNSTAEFARSIGVPTLQSFFSANLVDSLASSYSKADLVAGNNVYAHVPDINDFTLGITKILKQEGVVTLEFPHFLSLIQNMQFDTIYHEHFSYLTLSTVTKVFESAGLRVFDVEKLNTHGGSLRVYGCLTTSTRQTLSSVKQLIDEEQSAGLCSLDTYRTFQTKVEALKNEFLKFLIDTKKQGKKIIGYGAAAKGNTLLNFAGIKKDLLPLVCDAAPSKIGKLLPGSHIPVSAPSEIARQKPDYVLILPWNLSDEIMTQLSEVREWDGRFVTAIPSLSVSD